MCGTMNGESRSRIAAQTAEHRTVSMSPFGPADEIGMLNLMDAASRHRVLAEADATRCFDLAVDYFVGMPSWVAAGDPSYQISMSHTPKGNIAEDFQGLGKAQNSLVSYSGDSISMFTHCGTHIDALNHFGYHGKIWNGFDEQRHLGSRHWMVAGADKLPVIVANGILIDLPAAMGVDVLPDSYGVGELDLKNALTKQGSEIMVGDVVLVRTGRMRLWPDPAAYSVAEPGLNLEGARFLARAGAMVIGSDNIALEQMPTADPENYNVVHTYLLGEAGVPILEVVNLEELAAECVYRFAFVGGAIRLRGATGSPIRPVAFPLGH
jgi:kynurenine formamidase